MKELFSQTRSAAAVLLATVMLIASLPQTGIRIYAVSPANTENTLPPQEESVSSWDGSDSVETIPPYTAVSETGNQTDYPIDDTLGYALTNTSMTAGSYSAHLSTNFSFEAANYPAISNFTILYTTDSALDFFPRTAHASKADVTSAGFSAASLQNAGFEIMYFENSQLVCKLEGDFTAANNQPLTPGSTYYYRLAFSSSSEYYFLTAPKQFTTNPPLETSAVKIKELQAESVGYNTAKIIWTVENPNQEYIFNHRLYYTDLSRYYSAIACRDDEGNIIPGKYYALARPLGKTAVPRLTVCTGESASTVISAEEPLTLTPADISQASITALVQPGVYSAGLQIQITPWYEYDSLYGTLYYRAKSDTDWKTRSFTVTSSPMSFTECISALSPETDYDYYVTLATYAYNTDPIASVGSEAEPLSFTTAKLETYEDDLFPDNVFRKWIKQEMNLAEDDPITNETLARLTSLSWYWRTGDDAIRSLEGIQYLTGLNFINIQYHEITDLPDLSGLANLHTAILHNNKIVSGITADKLPAAFLEANPSWLSETTRAQRLPAKIPTQAEINGMFSVLSYDIALPNTHAIKPSTKSPYAAGRLSDDSLNNALNLMNFSRYVAGIPSDVTLSETYIELAQAGTLVNAVNDVMTHYPEQPEGFPDDLYEQAYTGCSSSNIARGYLTLGSSIADGWLHDGDSSNIDRLGHRRWVLNPSMSATGFGAVNSYSAMYSFDQGNQTAISDFVAWPARNMPLELITRPGYPWSISLGTDYRIPDTSAVSVTLRDTASDKTWTFDEKTSDYSNNYFSIDGGGYGSGTCIVFRPKPGDVSYQNGSRFEVSVSGLENRFGETASLNYTVTFFSLNKTDISIRLDQTSLQLSSGQTVVLTATVTSEDASDTPVTWSSSDPAVASVDENGKVTAIAPGDAVITASYKGKRATCNVAVRDYTIDRTELHFDLAQGAKTETLTISDGVNTVTNVNWLSTDESVAAVSKQNGCGIVTPKGAGTAQILARIVDGPSFTCTVTVTKDLLTSISFNIQTCSLEKGASRQLKVYFVPHDSTLPKEISYASDCPDVASVDTSGLVTAISRGTAVITASVNTNTGVLTARCTVTVTETAKPAQGNIPSGLQALTNVQTRLSDVSLEAYEGWEWENGDIALTQFAGMQEKSFAAVYHKEGYADYKTALNVSLTTLTGISILSGQTTLAAGQTAEADIQWKLSGPESILSQYANALEWSSNNPAVLDAVSVTSDTVTQSGIILKAGSTAGKATITARLSLGGKTYTARRTYTVTDKDIAVFGSITAEGFTPLIRDDSDTVCYQGKAETSTGSLLVTVSNASRLTVKSSNTKVITAGKAQAANGAFRIPLTMKAAGTARLTLTADDAAKTKTEVLLYVKDPKPNISESSVIVNKLKTSGSTLFIYPNDGYTVENCVLTGDSAALFEALTPGTETDSYQLKARRATANGTYKLTVKVTTAETTSAVSDGASVKTSFELPLTVKVTEQAPKYKIKQSSKANLFYRDLGTPRITVTTEEKLTDLTLTGCDFRLMKADGDTAYSYTILPDIAGTITSSCTNKGSLTLSFEGYETIQTAFTVGIESKKPKLTLDNKTVTLYPNAGVPAAKVKVNSGKQPLLLDAVTAALWDADGCSLTQTDRELTVSVADPGATAISNTKTQKAKIVLAHDNWTETITLPLTVRLDPGKPALRLQKTSLQLNADTATMAYDMAETAIFWKNGAWFAPNTDISVSAADAKSQAVIHEGIVFEQAGNRLLARLNNQDIAAGSYKFRVHAVGMSGTPASLTVKIVSTDPKKAVKLSAKGSIDVLNRSGSFVTVTPSLKSLNGTITDVALSGDFAHLFRASLSENGKILIYARETDPNGKEIALITKYNYPVNLILTLQNAEGETTRITTQQLRLKLKQGRPKVTATPKNPVFYSGAYNSVRLYVNTALKGANAPEITEIKLMNQTDLFDYSNGVLSLRNTGAAIKGKTYSLQFRITYRGQADNEKATVIKVNAKVK